MSNILKKICEDKSKEIEILKNKCSLNTLKKLVSDKIEKRDFKNKAIESVINKNNLIIGEIKKSSPSSGQIIKEYHPEEIAKTYTRNSDLNWVMSLQKNQKVFFISLNIVQALQPQN